MLSATSNSTRNRSPFTPSQWQELEHQALIYKYMVSGVPIPPELIFNVKRSLESSLTSRLFPHQSLGWGFQASYGRKHDPEPGRCKRTDGKKWRCSKEAYPDSKYCERHMHRGRNRSRKPVELSSSSITNSTTSTVTNNPTLSMNRNLSNSSNPNTGNNINSSPSTTSYSYSFSFSPLSSPMEPDFHSNPFLYSHSSSSSRPQNNTTHNLFLDSSSTSHIDKDYRYYSGMRDGGDERSLFPGNSRNLQDSYGQLTMNNYSRSQFENLGDNNGSSSEDHQQQQQQQRHCFVLGTDFKSSSSSTRSIKLEKDQCETQKSLHHFFGEWPPKNSDSWSDLSSTSRLHTTDS